MAFSFSGRTVPLTLRVCRSLVWAQAMYTLLAGVFVLLTAVLLGSSDAIPFHGGTVSGSGAVILGLVYVIAAAALTWLGVELGRPAQWARSAIVSMQVFLATLELYRDFALSTSMVINVALYVAIVALLFAPGTHRALDGPAQA